ncbi:MAG: membrane protein insertase YidC [Nitrospirae bacterium]|nr:membrane protein insertase YidC [Nitrospirota bacterium]
MERNAVIFLVMSVIIIIVYSLVVPPSPPPVPKPSASTVDEKPATPQRIATPRAEGEAPALEPGPERVVTVETDLYHATLSTRGAVITSWQLARYTNGPTKRAPVGLFTPPEKGAAVAPLAVVIEGSDEALNTAVLNGPYALEGGDLRLSADQPTGQLRFEVRTPSGQVVSKRLTFHHDSYEVDVELTARQVAGPYRLMLGENFGIRQWGDTTSVGYVGPTSQVDGKIIQDKPSKLEQPVIHAGRVAWTALQDKYFLAALIPQEPQVAVVAERFGDRRVTAGLQDTVSGETGTRRYRLYAGPKEYDRLGAMHVGLDATIDFGWFMFGSWSLVRLIAEPLFLILKFLHAYLGNYGVAIISLTALIKIVFIPLTHKSYVSMRAMSTLQPQLQALQKKYKHDKARLNQELMSLYKTNKVNPLGGCLPMVLQIPFFVAFFNILYTTIELRQAPFVFWITDLSDKDPSYVLPVLMGATMVLQQKLQPTTMDPKQAKLMLLMPVVFTFFFLSFPSGLVLYWMVNNLLSILQQYVTMKYLMPQAVVVSKGH